jgi:hypothetical protein
MMETNDEKVIELGQKIYTFFKNSLYLWAALQSPAMHVSLEGSTLEYKDLYHLLLDIDKLKREAALPEAAVKPHVNRSSTPTKPSTQQPSWLHFNIQSKWNSLTTWFKAKAKYLFVGGLGALAAIGIVSKARPTWMPYNLFKGAQIPPSSPTTSMEAPVVTGVKQQ